MSAAREELMLYMAREADQDQSHFAMLLDALEAAVAEKVLRSAAAEIRAAAQPFAPDTCYREAADLIDPDKK